jgi:hypothetical protein
MTTLTPEEKALNSAVAMKAARDRELAFRRAEAAETEVMMLRNSLQAVIDDVLHKNQITDRVWKQALAALEWSETEQEGEAE